MRILSRKVSRTEQEKSDLFRIGTQLNVDKAYSGERLSSFAVLHESLSAVVALRCAALYSSQQMWTSGRLDAAMYPH